MRFSQGKLTITVVFLLLITGLTPTSVAAQGPYGRGYYQGPYGGGYWRPPHQRGCYGGMYGCNYYNQCFPLPPPRQFQPPARFDNFYNRESASGYIVRPGDTIFSIARQFGISVRTILAANPRIVNPNLIFTGQRLYIPGGQMVKQSPQPTPQLLPSGQAQVIMQNISFQPQQIRISPGTSVIWINAENFAHTVTAGSRDNPSGLFDSGNIQGGGSFSFTFQNPGTYNYFCSIHPGMNGTIIVEEGTTPQTPMQQQQPPANQPAPGYGSGY